MNNLVNKGGVQSALSRKKKPEFNRALRQEDILPLVNSLAENVSLLAGHNKDKLERAVTYKDLIDSGYNIGQFAGVAPQISPPELPVDKPNLSVPPAVAGISVNTTFEYIHLSWNAAEYKNHAFVVVFRAPAFKADGVTATTFSDAEYLISSPTTAYSDKVLPADEMRYFFRNISDEGIYGIVSDGYYAKTALKPSYLIEKISGEIKKSDLWGELGSEITYASFGVSNLYTTTQLQGIAIDTHTETLAAQGGAIQTQAELISDIDGVIAATYTVKVDVGGYIAGFGLTNDGVTSAFGIRADRFWIAPPLGAAGDDIGLVPFIVDGGDVLINNAFIDTAYIETLVASQITADYINAMTLTAVKIAGGEIIIGNDFSVNTAGLMYSKNGYIESATAKSLVIRDAYNNVILSADGLNGGFIKNLTVDTLKIANNSVTASSSFIVPTMNIAGGGTGAAQASAITGHAAAGAAEVIVHMIALCVRRSGGGAADTVYVTGSVYNGSSWVSKSITVGMPDDQGSYHAIPFVISISVPLNGSITCKLQGNSAGEDWDVSGWGSVHSARK